MTLSRFLDPLLLLLVAMAIALFVWARRSPAPLSPAAYTGRSAAWAAWALLWTLASPWFANFLLHRIQPQPQDLEAVLARDSNERTALIVLSGGQRSDEPTLPPAERLDFATHGRVLGAARLFRAYRFGRVIISSDGVDTARGMMDLLVALGVKPDRIIADVEAVDTKTNAQNCIRLLRESGMDRAVLVTSAIHMPRAAWEFRRSGLEVIRAPVDYLGSHTFGPASLLPSSFAMLNSHLSIHEILGRLKP